MRRPVFVKANVVAGQVRSLWSTPLPFALFVSHVWPGARWGPMDERCSLSSGWSVPGLLSRSRSGHGVRFASLPSRSL